MATFNLLEESKVISWRGRRKCPGFTTSKSQKCPYFSPFPMTPCKRHQTLPSHCPLEGHISWPRRLWYVCWQVEPKHSGVVFFHWKQPSLFSVIDAHWRPYEAASFAKGGATLDSDINSPTHNQQKSTITKKVHQIMGIPKGYITVSPKESPALSINWLFRDHDDHGVALGCIYP